MNLEKQKKSNEKNFQQMISSLFPFVFVAVFMAFKFNIILGFIILFFIIILIKGKKAFIPAIKEIIRQANEEQKRAQTNYQNNKTSSKNIRGTFSIDSEIDEINPPTTSLNNQNPETKSESETPGISIIPFTALSFMPSVAPRLEKRKRYLQIALNGKMSEAESIARNLPTSDRIIVEVGTPLLKARGINAIERLRAIIGENTYIVADNKCADLADREVAMMAKAGANGATCLGVAPIETINSFIAECQKQNIDAMIDMMNVENPLMVLQKLKTMPKVVIVHRGVDESEISKEKQIPYYQIKQIKGNYNIMVAVAGGDTIKEAQSALFNDADIVITWKDFYQSNQKTAQLAESFLSEVK
ncbi:MAG: orotidine 5'-phosphate decarboxylase / HUMPS family protein [bacterium]